MTFPKGVYDLVPLGNGYLQALGRLLRGLVRRLFLAVPGFSRTHLLADTNSVG